LEIGHLGKFEAIFKATFGDATGPDRVSGQNNPKVKNLVTQSIKVEFVFYYDFFSDMYVHTVIKRIYYFIYQAFKTYTVHIYSKCDNR
jgi:hypothetical protein